MGIFSDKTPKGGKEARNRNSKIASYLQDLNIKKPEVWKEHTEKIITAVEEKKREPSGKTKVADEILDAYVTGMEFDQSKVSESEEEGSDTGLFTGMANVDWLLLAAFHLKKADYVYDHAIRLLKGVAAFSLLCPLTRVRAESLRTEWAVFEGICRRFQKGKELYMCPLALTPSRLVNSAAVLFEAASDICILRSKWSLIEITDYIAKQLEAQGGSSSLSKQPGTTSSVEWMVHRLLLTGANCCPSKFIKEQKNPLRTQVTVRTVNE